MSIPTTTSPPRPPSTTPARTARTPKTSANGGTVEMRTDGAAPRGLRIVLNAVEGWGKTSLAAYGPEPAILMAHGETGYETLLAHDRVPRVPRATVASWEGLLAFVREQNGECPYQLLALDAMGGMERLCHAHVCTRDFKGDWGEKGFMGYQRGYEVAVADWLQLLQALDALATEGMHVLLLGHVQVRPFKNPLGDDYDRFVGDLHPKTAAPTFRWADAVLFGTFRTILDDSHGKARPKGIGGQDRVLFTEHHDAYDAKNRLGMPAEIKVPNDPTRLWQTITDAIGTHPVSKETQSNA